VPSFGQPPEANLTDYLTFIRDVMGVPPQALSDNANVIPLTLDAAILIVNENMAAVGAPQALLPPLPLSTAPYASYFPLPPSYLAWAIYNYAADRLVTYTLDDPNAAPPYNTYWSALRKSMSVGGPVVGMISSSADQGTSSSYVVPDWAKTMTPGDLAMLKTPWGQQYITMALAYGPSIWGLT
jgi:hypothetical protein